MFERFLTLAVCALAAASLTAQTAGQKPAPPKPAAPKPAPAQPSTPPRTSAPYEPAIMLQRMVTLAGCLQYDKDYTLSEATVPGANEKTPAQAAPAPKYRIEGLSPARLSMLVGKRVQVLGAYQEAAKGAASALPRFEATNIDEAQGSCQAAK